MNILAILYVILLFVILTPGVVVTLPQKGSSIVVTALFHGIVFAILFFLTNKSVMKFTNSHKSHSTSKSGTTSKSNTTPTPSVSFSGITPAPVYNVTTSKPSTTKSSQFKL